MYKLQIIKYTHTHIYIFVFALYLRYIYKIDTFFWHACMFVYVYIYIYTYNLSDLTKYCFLLYANRLLDNLCMVTVSYLKRKI